MAAAAVPSQVVSIQADPSQVTPSLAVWAAAATRVVVVCLLVVLEVAATACRVAGTGTTRLRHLTGHAVAYSTSDSGTMNVLHTLREVAFVPLSTHFWRESGVP